MHQQCLNCFSKFTQLGKHGGCPTCGSQAVSVIEEPIVTGECLITETINTDIPRIIREFRAFFA